MKINNKKKQEKTTFVAGNFNILHPGHLRLLRFARELGYKLIVGVYSDLIAGNAALVKEHLRLDSIKSINWVDEAFIIDTSLIQVINKIKPSFIVKGKEYESQYNPEIQELEKFGGKLVFSSGETIFSAFDLIEKEFAINSSSNFRLPDEFLFRHKIDRNNLSRIIKSFNKLNVLVLGDTIVDEYINCDPLGMSQEDPTIVVKPIENKKYIGGAAIVAAHAACLGAKVNYISVCGVDESSFFVKNQLNSFNVDTHLINDESRPTTLKQRFRANSKTLLRVSHLHQGAISKEIQNKVFNKINNKIKNCDLVVFSDFNYGVLTQELVDKIIELANFNKVLVVADSQSSSQVGDISRFTGMDLITPTEREARLSIRDSESGLIVLAEKLKLKSNAKNILLKIGAEGVIIHSNDDNWTNDRIPALNSTPIDVSGAGDSMLISASMALASNANIWEATIIGSIAAAIQVSRVGNIPIKYNELIEKVIN
jgi:rfaE bifunctional protein kinase chain/domain